MGSFMAAFVLTVELVGHRTRTFHGNFMQAPFALGEALVAAMAIAFDDWRQYHVSAFFRDLRSKAFLRRSRSVFPPTVS